METWLHLWILLAVIVGTWTLLFLLWAAIEVWRKRRRENQYLKDWEQIGYLGKKRRWRR